MLACLNHIWHWVWDRMPYILPALSSLILVVAGAVMSLPDLATTVEVKYKRLFGVVCIVAGLIGFSFDVSARRSDDQTNQQLLGNIATAVQNTNDLVQQTKGLVTISSQMAANVSISLPQIAEMNVHMSAIDRQLKTARDPQLIADLQAQKAELQKQGETAVRQLLHSAVNGLASSLINLGESWFHEQDKAIMNHAALRPPPTPEAIKQDAEAMAERYQPQANALMTSADSLRLRLLQYLPSQPTQQDKDEAVIFAKGVAGQPLGSTQLKQAGNYLFDLSKRAGVSQ